MPDEIHEPMEVSRNDHGDDQDDGEAEGELALPPVVPIPSGADLEALGDQPKIDSWAQLTFQEEGSGEICVVRRALMVSTRGKIGMSVTSLKELGIPDLAIEAGTLMPGIAAHMRFDEKTTFAQAIAQLTGLKPLEDLGRRSARVVRRLRKDEKKAAESGARTKLTEFKEKRQNIVDAWSAQPDLGKPAELIAPNQQKEDEKDTSKKSIADAHNLLEEKKQTLERTAETTLGTALQLASDDQVSTLLQQLGKAADTLKPASLAALPSVAVIKNLRAVSDDDYKAAETLIDDMIKRAKAVTERLRNKLEAARWQLYAKVAVWHSEHHRDAELKDCPVCGTDLETVPPDALLDKAVKDALALCSQEDTDAAKGAEEWERDAAREFLDILPESLRAFADKAPPDDLLSIYHKAYVEELLADRAFANRLSSLKQNAGRVWEIASKDNKLPDTPAPHVVDFPDEFKNGALAQRIAYIVKAVVLSKHLAEATDAIKVLVERYIGSAEKTGTEHEGEDIAASVRPLCDQIEAVRTCVENTSPIVSILRQLDDLEKTRKEYAVYIARLVLIDEAATAIEAFSGFEDLVYQQVSGLIQALDTDIRRWLGIIYSPHYRGGPTYSGIDLGEETGLGLRASIGGMQVPAYKIMNASLLRACVWAFVFSLWDRAKVRLGGLDCMLLDDPQTHFDPINAENLAATILQMPEHGMRPLITSGDNRFVASIRDKLHDRSTVSPTWHAWTLNPISSSRLTAGVSPAVEEIFERMQEVQKDENNVSKAQQFVSTVRLYVENRLWDLLATDPMVMHKPTLADLIQSVRTAHNNGERPFDEPPFRLCSPMRRSGITRPSTRS